MTHALTIEEFHARLTAEQEESDLLNALRELIRLDDAEEIRKILGRERAFQGWTSWK
jgi:hypothetical protein